MVQKRLKSPEFTINTTYVLTVILLAAEGYLIYYALSSHSFNRTTMLYSVNGQLVPEDDARIPLNDRGFLFGDGVFTTLKVSNGCIEAYALHKERFLSQAKALKLVIPEVDISVVLDFLCANGAETGCWRLKWILTAGSSSEREGLFIMMLSPYHEVKSPLTLTIYPYPLSSSLHHFKTLAYLERFWIQEFGIEKGYDDTLTLDNQGNVLETAFANIFWCSNSCYFTPAFSLPIFKGITIQILSKLLKINEIKTTLSEIPPDAHLFSCNSLQGIRAIASIGDVYFPLNPSLEEKIRHHYAQEIATIN